MLRAVRTRLFTLAVAAYVLLAVALVALGTVREHPPLTWMAMFGLVVFTTFQSFAVSFTNRSSWLPLRQMPFGRISPMK